MSQGEKHQKRDRVIELFRERKLHRHLKPLVALCIEIILKTGATPIDLINIQPEHINKATHTLSLHIQKKKELSISTHNLSKQSIQTFFELESKKPLSSHSIRRIQQLIKEETTKIGSALHTPRQLRASYLQQLFSQQQELSVEQTQLTSISTRKTLSLQEQQILFTGSYDTRNKALILTLLHTGIRIRELLSLHAKDIQQNKLVVDEISSYNKTARSISLPQKIIRLLPQQGYLFTTNRHNRMSQRRFEQICKEVGAQFDISELSPSIIRATAIKNLSTSLSQEELLKQTGLGSNTLYTHAILSSTIDLTSTTTTSLHDSIVERKDSDANDADRFMYMRSKLRDGGDTDE